ncbi:MAG: uracil-xanthine permease [Bacilli bacterium]|nr:uracil-xanthine permease [Bacilli bacterium]
MSDIVYSIEQRPPVGKTLLSAFQQILSILAATIAVPAIVGHGMSQSAALFGAGIGTLVYLLITKFKSPVFLGSSFAFLGSMGAAFAGALNAGLVEEVGYIGLLIGALLAGLVYVVLSIIVKFFGTAWVDKIMPPVVIGPTVAIIGLTLAPNAVGDLTAGNVLDASQIPVVNPLIALLVGLITLFATIAFSVFGKKILKMIPFILGIFVGYLFASIFTIIGNTTGTDALKIIDFSLFESIKWIPDFSFIKAFANFKEFSDAGVFFKYFGMIALAYIPVAFVTFSEHIADHKNLSSIVGVDLLETPGLHRTILGDGLGSITGAFFGGCPNTTYGESIACTAISGNTSTITILVSSLMAICIAFLGPVVTFFATVPKCVMGGVCLVLYGFIAVSGLKMLKDVDLSDNRNIFTISVILICGVGGLILEFFGITITEVAFALILGVITNLIVHIHKPHKKEEIKEDNLEQQGSDTDD